MFNSISLCYWCIKTIIYLCRLFDNDLDKNKFVVEKIRENFDLSPRGIREMLNLNKPIYEKTASYGHLVDHLKQMVHFMGKTDKTNIFLNSFC